MYKNTFFFINKQFSTRPIYCDEKSNTIIQNIIEKKKQNIIYFR